MNDITLKFVENCQVPCLIVNAMIESELQDRERFSDNFLNYACILFLFIFICCFDFHINTFVFFFKFMLFKDCYKNDRLNNTFNN